LKFFAFKSTNYHHECALNPLKYQVTAMEMGMRQAADLPGPGEYENFDRDHRDVHLTKLAGKFSESARMGRDLAMAEAAQVSKCVR